MARRMPQREEVPLDFANDEEAPDSPAAAKGSEGGANVGGEYGENGSSSRPNPSETFLASCEIQLDEGAAGGGGPDVSATHVAMRDASRRGSVMRRLQMEEIRSIGSRSVVMSTKQLDNKKIDRAMSIAMGVKLEEKDDSESEEEEVEKEKEKGVKTRSDRVAVFNANSIEGCSIVRTLAKQGSEVVAIVRVTTSRNVRQMVRLEQVTVIVADSLHDKKAIADAIRGCSQVFYVLKYWEKFDGALEEIQAFTIFDACAMSGVNWVIFATYEDASLLRRKRIKSQIVPKADGTVAEPTFVGLRRAKEHANKHGIRVTHMITSYLDHKGTKRSLTLIKGEEKLIVVSNN